jgi:hypothetical protein
LERRWIEVTSDTQVEALLDAVKYGLKSEVHDANDFPRRTMVFTNQSWPIWPSCTEANRDLVRAVRQAEELAQPVVRHFCPFSPFWNATIFSPENAYIYIYIY